MYDIMTSIVILVVLVLLVGLEIFLAMRKRWWWGTIPIVMLTAVLLIMNVSANHELSAYKAETLKGTDGNGHQLELTIRYDSEGKLVDFSELRIKDTAGELLDEVFLDFTSSGELVADDSVKIHKEDVQQLIGTRALTGFSIDSETMNSHMVRLSDSSYVGINNIFYAIAAQVGPLLLLYVVCRLVVRYKDRGAGLKRLEIDSL